MGRIFGCDALVALFTERTGIAIPASRRRIFDAALQRAMRLSRPCDFDHFRERINTDDTLLEEIIRELAVGETYFFRDHKHFDFVRQRVVPEVFARSGMRHVLRAWSAGCSTGEEPYSLAIAFEEDRLADRTHILATDLSRRSLEHATRGAYRPWSLRGEGALVARKYLHDDGAHWVIEPRIKRRVEFRQLNLVNDAYPAHEELDVIFCRNVLIYFDREAVAIVARKLAAALRDGGYLIMGPSDPSLMSYAPLEPLVTPDGIFFRRKTIPQAVVPALVHAPAPPEPEPIVPRVAEKCAPDAPLPAIDPRLEAARVAMAQGEYARAAELTHDTSLGLEASLIHLRALANIDVRVAEHACASAVAMFPMSPELRYFHASFLVELGRDVDAERTLRRALYLDRTLAVCHALLGMLLVRRGERHAAERAFRNAHRICSALDPESPVRLSNGEPARVMAKAMARQLEGLGVLVEVAP